MRPSSVVLVCALTLLVGGAGIAAAGLFDVPAPEKIYEGTAPGVDSGVLVIRRAEAYEIAIRALDPVYGGEAPDLGERTILRIVGRARENACRETILKEVSTRNLTATVVLEERVPAAGCECPEVASPPRAWLVQVARVVRRAKVQVTDVVVECGQEARQVDTAEIAQIYQGSWDHEPGSEILTREEDYAALLKRLGVADRGPQVDFSTHRVIAVTARPRANACRKTAVVGTALASSGEAVFTIEETYPAQGQLCAQVYSLPRVFLYRVPKSVSRARIVTREKRS